MVATKTVVVADDTAFVRDRFRAALESAGHRALTMRSGAELMKCARADLERLDLIILDLRLPRARGADLVRSLRAVLPAYVPIVVFSGTIANADEVREIDALGVAGYVNEYATAQHIVPSLEPYLFPESVKRRSSPRVALGIPATYRFGSTIASSVTLSISRGGLAIRTTSPLNVGAKVRVRFRLPGTSTDVDEEAGIVWTERRLGMGLQFTAIAQREQAAIDDFVRTRFFSNRKA